jgi:hypothetical protein
MKPAAVLLAALLLAPLATLHAAETPVQSYDALVTQRLREGLSSLEAKHWPPSKVATALFLLFKHEKVDEASRLIQEHIAAQTNSAGKIVAENRCEGLFRVYLLERTGPLLSPQARAAIEAYAWNLLETFPGAMRKDADKPFWDFDSSENHYVNFRRRVFLALSVVRKSERYGPRALLEGEAVESHYQAWIKFWVRYFHDRAVEGSTDLEVAHPGSYGVCTVGVYYDLHDLTDNSELRAAAAKFLTLYWAEVATEFEPRTGGRALAMTRAGETATGYWARMLLGCYGWHDEPRDDTSAGNLEFLTSSYRPPEILRAIARDKNRGCYLATSRRVGLARKAPERGLAFDEGGGSRLRRDVYYTPDYSLATMAIDPEREYDVPITLYQTMGATFSAEPLARLVVTGTGFYAHRAANGITGNGVSIIARDPKATFGLDRFKSNGTRVYITKGGLWDNHVEDASGWLFTRSGDAYAALRVPQGYTITNRTYIWPNRKLQEVEESKGYYLELKDMWVPVVIQMGRAAGYKSFEGFQASVKENRFEYQDGKLTYVSEAGETFEVWAKGAQMPKMNGTPVNLNPAKTYDSPFLSMAHGAHKAVITYPGHEDLVLEF